MVFVHSNEIQFDDGIINQEIFFTKISMLKFSLSKNDIFRMKGSECCVWYSFPAEWNSKLFPLYYLFCSVFMHWMSRTEQKKKPEHVEMREKVENVLSTCLLVYFLMVVKFPVRLSCKNTHFFLPQFLRDMTHRQPIPHKISTDVKKILFLSFIIAWKIEKQKIRLHIFSGTNWEFIWSCWVVRSVCIWLADHLFVQI